MTSIFFILPHPHLANPVLSPIFFSLTIALKSTHVRNLTYTLSSCISLTIQTSQSYLRNPLHCLSHIHFPGLKMCTLFMYWPLHWYLCYQTLFYPTQGIQDPRHFQLPVRENPHSSSGNTRLCLNTASDYFILHHLLYSAPTYPHTCTPESYHLS